MSLSKFVCTSMGAAFVADYQVDGKYKHRGNHLCCLLGKDPTANPTQQKTITKEYLHNIVPDSR